MRVLIGLKTIIWITFILSPLNAAQPPLEHITISPYPEVEEGTFVKFTYLDNNAAEVKWSFGDGESASGTEVFHAYFLDKGVEMENFTITVEVVDVNGASTIHTVDILVKRAPIKVRILKPADLTERSFRKDESIEITFAVLNKDGEPLTDGEIKRLETTFRGQSLIVERKGTIYLLRLDGNYSFRKLETLKIVVEGEKDGNTVRRVFEAPIRFKPALINVTLKQPTTYFGQEIGVLTLTATYPNLTKAEHISVEAYLLSKRLRRPFEVEYEKGEARLGIEYKPTIEDVKEGLWIEFEGKDPYGNIIPKQVIKLDVRKDDPKLDLVIISPPSGAKFHFAQPINIIATINSNAQPRNPKVYLIAHGRKYAFSYDGSIYTLKYRDSTVNATVKHKKFLVVAEGIVGAQRHADFEYIDLNFTSKVELKIVAPTGMVVALDQPGPQIVAEILYPDGTKLDKNSVFATFTIDHTSYKLMLTREESTGLFKASLPARVGTGTHTITLTLGTPYSATASTTFYLVPGLAVWLAILIIALLSAGFVVAYTFLQKRRRQKEKIEALKAKKRKLEQTKAYLKEAFFALKLSKDEYSKRLLEIQQELEDVEKELAELTRKDVRDNREGKTSPKTKNI
jgi:hypothetical protein